KNRDQYSHNSDIRAGYEQFIINVMSSPGSWWFIYPLFGWGLGILVHVTFTFVFSRWGFEWEERKIKELLSKDR
ncbi:MAG: 2TM domain-containing protein, partial [Bacillus sp. (in: firmicutes)]